MSNDNMPQPKGHLLIALTTNRSGPTWELHKCLQYAFVELFSKGWLVTEARSGSADLEDGRNQLFTTFANNPKFTKALFLDDDVHWDGDAIWRIVNHPVDFVLGAYPKRADAEGFPITMADDTIEFVNPVTREPDPKGGLLKVNGGPTGFLCITRACAERLIAAAPDRWYHQPLITGTQKAWEMFEFAVHNHVRHSEDKNFCRKWRELGGEVWCDPHLMLHHKGDKIWSGCFAHHLRHIGLMRPGQVVKIPLVGGPETSPATNNSAA